MTKQVVIGPLGNEHFDESMLLSQFAFQYEKSAEELVETKKQFAEEPAARYAACVDEQFAAQATVLELQTYIGGKVFKMGGLAGVATWPEFRRQGLVAQILVQALHEMKQKGQVISYLHPFMFGFYRKFGWETYTENKTYTIQKEQLPARLPFEGHVERFKGDYKLLSHLYEAYASQYNGSLVRSDLWWKYRISKRKPGQIALYYDASSEAQGYIIYEVKNSRLTVHELIYLNEPARAALWSFISQHDSMIHELKITVPSDDQLPFLLANPRIKQEVIPYFMARIVDAEQFISQYAFIASATEDLIPIQLRDDKASWNNGIYLLNIDGSGKAVFMPIEAKETLENPIKMDIGALTTMLLGYLRPTKLAQLARIDGDDKLIKRLQARIPERTTYLPDFF
ncbi:putative acetyltransferase [Paenibacillus endophyticus]|uniref:Putative acetyltransferase n=1 Tax=Paenibacillus endophyticus TaxID=1294268 RepID=A0A7W5CEY4_9BACL|nr:GNAT family N-acetyltransferase [Paenibacillus endophyticus]MBB3156030.1 putative acetyltransferase [Paenibacillus endophyticus]